MIEANCRFIAVDKGEPRRTPRALADACCAKGLHLFGNAADGRAGPGAAALPSGEVSANDLLYFGQCAAEGLDVVLLEAGNELHQDEMADVGGGTFGKLRQCREGFFLGVAGDARLAGIEHQ